jgi:3-oxoacyl-[acyl-carrier-protein] synthase-3
MNATITGMHYCIPKRRLTNEELIERFGERPIKSITKMSGVQERRVVSPGETAADLGYWAARRLMTARGISPEEIDLIIFVSQTGDYSIPATACVLHDRLSLSQNCAAFDINLGCTGFPYSLSVVKGMLVSGIAHKALLINGEALTSVIHPKDRGLVPLHGDGAVASIIEPSADKEGLVDFLLGTDGSGYKHLMIPASGARIPRSDETRREVEDESGITRTQEHLHMNGPAIFHFSVYKVPEVINDALQRFGLTIDDIDLLLLHQANKTMVDQIYRVLNVPEEKRFYFMEQVGNLSGASSAALLAEAWRQGRIKPGSRTLLAAFGVGLSWAVALIVWPNNLLPAVDASVEPGEDDEAI